MAVSYRITDRCRGCTLCARHCPVKAIDGAPKQLHRIDPDRCVSCGVCGLLCAFGAVVNDQGGGVSRLPREQWYIPEVDETLCAACSVCVENCPTESLAISEPRFHGDIALFAVLCEAETCVGCGICADRCPVGAVVMTSRRPAPVPAAAGKG